MDDLERNKALIKTYWDAVNGEDYADAGVDPRLRRRNHAPAAFDLLERAFAGWCFTVECARRPLTGPVRWTA